MPTFITRKDQIDFTNARWAPVINCVVKYKNKILIVKRSAKLNFYPDYWNGISGFLDDNKSLEEKVYEELREELGIRNNHIKSTKLGEIFDQEEPKYNKTWIVHPVLVVVDTNGITLDWEAKEIKWILVEDVFNYKLLPGFDKVIKILFRI